MCCNIPNWTGDDSSASHPGQNLAKSSCWLSRMKRRLRRAPRRSRGSRGKERRVASTDMEMENLKLYLENRSIMEENKKLRERALLLHKEKPSASLPHAYQQPCNLHNLVIFIADEI